MTPFRKTRTGSEGYRECYVAFLDILGFRTLLQRSEGNPEIVRQLSSLTALAATSGPDGEKLTDVGPCLMQTRAFSDCLVIFTPVVGISEERHHPNPLAQLLFLVRYLHDRILDLGACVRGGVTLGSMYWHPAWSNPNRAPDRRSKGSLPLAFGTALAEAYELESEKAQHPRVALSARLIEAIQAGRIAAHPFGDFNGGSCLDAFLRSDGDGITYLDLLHRRVTRSSDERMITKRGSFTVQWTDRENTNEQVLHRCQDLIDQQLPLAHNDRVRSKYEWLQRYVASHRPALPTQRGES